MHTQRNKQTQKFYPLMKKSKTNYKEKIKNAIQKLESGKTQSNNLSYLIIPVLRKFIKPRVCVGFYKHGVKVKCCNYQREKMSLLQLAEEVKKRCETVPLNSVNWRTQFLRKSGGYMTFQCG